MINNRDTIQRGTAAYRRRDIQGLRALAVILVVAFHAGLPIPGGYIGVDVFFVISGFVITAMLQRSTAAGVHLRFRVFYWRRFTRLIPSLALVVSVVFILAIFIQSPFGAQGRTLTTGLGAMAMVANLVIARSTGGYFDAAAGTNPLLNTWSLSVEEQFYLFFPAVLAVSWLLMRRNSLRARIDLVLIIGIMVFSLGLALFASSGTGGTLLHGLAGFYAPFGRFWEFAIGALAALTINSLKRIPIRLCLPFMLVGTLLIIVSSLTFSDQIPFPGPATIVPVLGTLLILIAGTPAGSTSNRWLQIRSMNYLGDISYTWYLWHWPLIVFAAILWPGSPVAILTVAVASLVPSALTHRYLEQPLRRISLNRRSSARLVLLVVLPVLLSGAALGIGAYNKWWITWPAQPNVSESASMIRGCHNQGFDPTKCTWPIDQAEGTVLLVGDSQAFALSDAVIANSSLLRLNTVISSENACPFIAAHRIKWDPRFIQEKSGCSAWQDEVLQYALETRPKLVIVANRSPLYTGENDGYATLLNSEGVPAASRQEVLSNWAQALEAVVKKLSAAGVPVLIVTSPPSAQDGVVELMPSLLKRNSRLPAHASTSWAESQLAASTAVEGRVASGDESRALLDLSEYLCNASFCPAEVDGSRLYSDSTHLSVAGSNYVKLPLLAAERDLLTASLNQR